MENIESNVAGIPCLIEILQCTEVKPWTGPIERCPSSDDFYGYTEIAFNVLDRKGYRADWLTKKLSEEDVERIEEEIFNHCAGYNEDY